MRFDALVDVAGADSRHCDARGGEIDRRAEQLAASEAGLPALPSPSCSNKRTNAGNRRFEERLLRESFSP
jgi:hypothetical protein